MSLADMGSVSDARNNGFTFDEVYSSANFGLSEVIAEYGANELLTSGAYQQGSLPTLKQTNTLKRYLYLPPWASSVMSCLAKTARVHPGDSGAVTVWPNGDQISTSPNDSDQSALHQPVFDLPSVTPPKRSTTDRQTATRGPTPKAIIRVPIPTTPPSRQPTINTVISSPVLTQPIG